MKHTRRHILSFSSAAVATAIAGCQSGNSDNETENHTKATPENIVNNTEPETPEPETPEPETPESYRADRKRISSEGSEPENIGDYSTEQKFDNLVTNTEEVYQAHQAWTEQQAYSPLVEQIMEGEDFSTDTYSFPNWEEDSFFDQSAVQEENDFETVIRWYLPAIMHYDRENYGNAPSSRNHRFAATLEKLINEHHPDEETEATSVTALPGHGIFGIQDENEEEFYMVDTTSSPQYDGAVGRIGDFNTSGFDPSRDLSRQNLWDPFHEFEPGPIDFLPYASKSRRSMGALMEFSATNEMGDNFDQFFITDEWMDEAYEVLRNGGSIQPIIEPIEELLYSTPNQDEGNTIGVYGTLEDTRIAVSSDDEIYEKVMHETEPQSTEDIESMLKVA